MNKEVVAEENMGGGEAVNTAGAAMCSDNGPPLLEPFQAAIPKQTASPVHSCHCLGWFLRQVGEATHSMLWQMQYLLFSPSHAIEWSLCIPLLLHFKCPCPSKPIDRIKRNQGVE